MRLKDKSEPADKINCREMIVPDFFASEINTDIYIKYGKTRSLLG